MNKWRKFWELEAWERRLFLQSLVLLAATAVALRLFSFQRWQSMLGRISKIDDRSSAQSSEQLVLHAHQTTKIVHAAVVNSPRRAKCLVESLALWCLLRRQGISSEIRFGSRKQADLIEAHAWVELNGTPLNYSAPQRDSFAPFASVPARIQP